jgi:hypothetical protein
VLADGNSEKGILPRVGTWGEGFVNKLTWYRKKERT